MASSLFQNQPRNQITSNSLQLISEFKKFISSGITPKKAEQIVKEKLNDGTLSAEQFDYLTLQAKQIQKMFGLFN